MKKMLFFLLFPFILSAQKDYTAELDNYMLAEVAINNFNGNVLVAKSGNIIYQKSFGYRNYNTKELLDSNSVFELASISKQFTAMGILLLKEKGRLNLSDTLRKFFPELPYSNITICNMLTHTSGLPDYGDAMSKKWDHKKVAFNDDAINFLAKENLPVNFKPGEKWEYSNSAYDLLASITEKVSGKDYAEYMKENIFNPLGMNNSLIFSRRASSKIIPNYAYGYLYSDSLKRYILPDSLPKYDIVIWADGIQGAGLVNSTTGDLYKWDRALKNHLLLNEVTNTEMLSPQSTEDSISKKYYGYGVMLGENDIGNYVWHTGGWHGYRLCYIRYLKDDITIIVLSNNESNSRLLSGALAYIITNRPVDLPYKHIAITVDTLLFERYIGKYSVQYGPTSSLIDDLFPIPSIIEIFKKDGKLIYFFESKKNENELRPESENIFFVAKNPDVQIEFEKNENGDIQKVFYIVHGMKNEMHKIF